MVHITQSFSGAYLALPTEALKEGESASGGTGIEISTLFATERCLNCERALIIYSMRLPLYGSTTASIQISGRTWDERRYDMSSNSPSGGMKLMVRSFSKRARRTHWWNLMSSISTALPLAAVRPLDSKSSLSLSPSFSSGIPLRYDRIFSAPRISERRMFPLEATRMLTDSTTSRKISFLRYLIPSERHETTPVTAGGGLAMPAILWLSCMMYSDRIFWSVIWGYPQSIISSSSS
mmetsp:Transcript_20203/g.48210  ORF Transcript_20203/g.48210 Transcript_20203/m.48210 type:complete len:236 (-) Transcript_20203:555-1262(-)